MKTIKVIMYVLWILSALAVMLFVISWLTSSQAALAWGTIGIIGLPFVGVLTGVYFTAKAILNKHGKLF